jgi:hypothetical protein
MKIVKTPQGKHFLFLKANTKSLFLCEYSFSTFAGNSLNSTNHQIHESTSTTK